MKGYVDLEIAGQWVQIWSTDATSGTSDKPAWLTITKDSGVSTAVKLNLAVQTDDETQFTGSLVTS